MCTVKHFGDGNFYLNSMNHSCLSPLQLFRLSGRLREIHTRKRDSQVVEYGLFAICSPANNPNSHHAGSSIKKEVALTAQKRLERSSSDPVCVRYNNIIVLSNPVSMDIIGTTGSVCVNEVSVLSGRT